MAAPFKTFQEFLNYLDKLNFFHMDLSLSRMDRALEELQLKRPPFFVAQVCGTNGKGSTASFLASLLKEAGVTTGLYTSPHFVSPAERILVNGRPLGEDEWLEAALAAWQAEPRLTYFEILTVMALFLFRESGVQCAVMEAGLGARYDATTATAADLVCYAPIALDHTAILGPTLEAIADDKSYAIRTSAPVISAPQFPAAESVLRKRAESLHAPITFASPVPEGTILGLAGDHQRMNAGTALAAFRKIRPWLALPEDPASEKRGLEKTFIPGRLQFVPEGTFPGEPAYLLDGAHNPHGMTSLVHYLGQGGVRPAAVVFSCLHDKNWHPVLEMLAHTLPGVPFFVPAMHNDRAEKAETIAALLRTSSQCPSESYSHLDEALAAAARATGGKGPVLVTGSLYLLSDFFASHTKALSRLS